MNTININDNVKFDNIIGICINKDIEYSDNYRSIEKLLIYNRYENKLYLLRIESYSTPKINSDGEITSEFETTVYGPTIEKTINLNKY